MKLRFIQRILLLQVTLFFVACSSSSSGGDDDTPPPPPMVASPSSAILIFPEDDTECNTGEIINDSQSNVTFEWNASENTDSYVVNLTNLNTNSTTQVSITTNEATISIERGVPYEWMVTSRASGTTESANSLAWRFYNEGPGVENYAPFPAEAISPERGANIDTTTSINLQWTTSDIDDDIEGYQIFLDTNASPNTSVGSTTDPELNNVTVSSGNTYYWKILTLDSAGNTSTSEIFQFRIL